MTKSQMAFELPRLSYIDTRWEEPATEAPFEPARERGFASWFARRRAALKTWREDARARAELNSMSDRELFDIGLNRGDLDRVFDDRLNQDLLMRSRAF
jgi:uncharacterized protein YjiS (DUF1127 family)